jgi:hypothetical protein
LNDPRRTISSGGVSEIFSPWYFDLAGSGAQQPEMVLSVELFHRAIGAD